jgi:hypothetical protein
MLMFYNLQNFEKYNEKKRKTHRKNTERKSLYKLLKYLFQEHLSLFLQLYKKHKVMKLKIRTNISDRKKDAYISAIMALFT